MKPRTQAGRALFNRHAWRLEDPKFAEDIAAIEREAAEQMREALGGLDAPFRWIESHYPKALVEMPSGILHAFDRAHVALKEKE